MHAFTTRHRNLRGIAWLMLSLPCFQTMNVMLRHVAADLPPVETMFFRNLFGFIILLPLFLRRPEALRTRPDQSDTLRNADIPALVLCGEYDVLCPVDRHREMARLLPRARLEIIAEAGHLPTLERPDATTDALRRWLDDDG